MLVKVLMVDKYFSFIFVIKLLSINWKAIEVYEIDNIIMFIIIKLKIANSSYIYIYIIFCINEKNVRLGEMNF